MDPQTFDEKLRGKAREFIDLLFKVNEFTLLSLANAPYGVREEREEKFHSYAELRMAFFRGDFEPSEIEKHFMHVLDYLYKQQRKNDR